MPSPSSAARLRGPASALLLMAGVLTYACTNGGASPGGVHPSPSALPVTPSASPTPSASLSPAPIPGVSTLTVTADQHLLHERTFKPAFASAAVQPGFYTVALDSALTSRGKRVKQVIVYSASPYDSAGWFHVLTHDQPLKLHIGNGTLYAGLVGLAAEDTAGTATVSVYDMDGLPLAHAVVDGKRHVVKLDSFQPASVSVAGGSYAVGVRTTLTYGSPATAVPKTLVIVPDSPDETGWYHLALPGAGFHVPATTLYATSLAPDTGNVGSTELTLRRL